MTKDDLVGFGTNDVISVVLGPASRDKMSCLCIVSKCFILMGQEGFTAGWFGVELESCSFL